jgi:two-component system phosphate regulon response regulator OmpR
MSAANGPALNGAAHIVVVDDEADLRDAVGDYLRGQGFVVSAADGGAALRKILAERSVDLVILDVRMPGEDGISIARDLRSRGPIAILMLTANRDIVDRVIGLEVGADDYLPKPFDLRELLARVRAVLRRAARPEPAAIADSGHEIRFGRCILNLDSRMLYGTDGSPVAITAMEFDLLRAFAERPNRVLTRDQLLDLAHASDGVPFDRSIDTRIARIRRKIEPDPAEPSTLKTVRGAGYMFVPAGVADAG